MKLVTALHGSGSGRKPPGPHLDWLVATVEPHEHSWSGVVENSVVLSRGKWPKPAHDSCVCAHGHACSDKTECGLRSETTLSALKSNIINLILAETGIMPKSEKSTECLVKKLLTRACAGCRGMTEGNRIFSQ